MAVAGDGAAAAGVPLRCRLRPFVHHHPRGSSFLMLPRCCRRGGGGTTAVGTNNNMGRLFFDRVSDRLMPLLAGWHDVRLTDDILLAAPIAMVKNIIFLMYGGCDG